jgi:murein L,D-transpeptidase YafK
MKKNIVIAKDPLPSQGQAWERGNPKTVSNALGLLCRLCLLAMTGIVLTLSSCGTIQMPELPFDWRSVMNRLSGDLETHQVYVGDPVFIRIFKEENILELWMQPQDSNQFTLIKTYPICNWSGTLGPKFAEGDHQAPEGFYATTTQQLNPNSQYHVSFNLGFPNAYDRAHGRTGSFIMIHGDCVSEGCYAMRDKPMEEIYTLVERALDQGQEEVPVHIFPFRMTSERLLPELRNPAFDFWMNLKEGYDYFEQYSVPPKWVVRHKRYEFY